MQAIQSATQAYGAAQGLSALNLNGMEMSSSKTALQESGSSQTFGDMVDHAIKRLENQTIGTDQTAVNLAKGEANIVDVVTAVAETELALETLISVRDQVISSYQEILRMPI